jgi:hypothetical protein
MNFERNNNPKESMGIGLESDSVSVEKIEGEIYLKWDQGKLNLISEKFKIRKRWFIPKKNLLGLLEKEKVSALHLSFLCKAKVYGRVFTMSGIWQYFFPWLFIFSKVRLIKKHQPLAIIHLASKWNIDRQEYTFDSSNVFFSITSYDLKKIIAMERKNSEGSFFIKGAIHKGKIYPIKHGSKTLI